MAADWVRNELQALAGSASSHKDSVEKYRKIFQKIIKSNAKVLIGGLRDFIETGTLDISKSNRSPKRA